MRSLKDLFENGAFVWIFCREEKYQVAFLEQAEAEGFLALDGQKPTELFHHQLYGIDDSMQIGYLSAMIWHMTANCKNDNHVRVDYEKYIAAEEDYRVHL